MSDFEGRQGRSDENRRSHFFAKRTQSFAAEIGAPLRTTLEAAGVEFIDEDGGGAGVRLKKPGRPMTKR